MIYKREIKIGDAIRAFLREEGLETPLNEYRAGEAFRELMGPVVSRYTSKVEVRGGTLFLQIQNAALRQELMMQRQVIIQRINNHVGAQVLQQIIIR